MHKFRLPHHCQIALLAAMLALAPVALAEQAWADATPSPALTALRHVVDQMGYTTTLSPTGGHFYIENNDKYDYTVDFSLSDDNSYLWVYTQVQTYTAPQLQRLPMRQLLEANDSSPEFFSLHNDSGSVSLYLQIALPVEGVSAKTLRTIINHINNDMNDDDASWNPTLWK
jgi:hypothetical protein